MSEAGTPFDSGQWRNRAIKRALEQGGLRKINAHDLRNSHAGLLIRAGESLAYVRDQLGHQSIKVAVDIYGHLAPEGNKAAVDRLDDDSHTTIRNLSATNNNNKEKGLSQQAKPFFLTGGVEGT